MVSRFAKTGLGLDPSLSKAKDQTRLSNTIWNTHNSGAVKRVVEQERLDRTSRESNDGGDERSGESGPSLPINELALTIINALG